MSITGRSTNRDTISTSVVTNIFEDSMRMVPPLPHRHLQVSRRCARNHHALACDVAAHPHLVLPFANYRGARWRVAGRRRVGLRYRFLQLRPPLAYHSPVHVVSLRLAMEGQFESLR